MIHLYTPQTTLAALVSAVPSRSADTEATLSVADGHATLSTVTDGGATRARIRRAVDVQRPGDVVVSASVLRDAVRGLPKGGTVEVKQSAAKLTLSAGGSRVTIPIIPDAPPSWWTPPQPTGAWRFAAEPLVSALRRVRASLPAESTRYGINGVHVERHEGGARFVATMGHTLHTVAVPALDVGDIPSKVLLSPAAVAGIEAAAVGEVSLLIDYNSVTLWVGDDVLSWGALDGEFPDWRAAIPGEHRRWITVNTEELLAALRRHVGATVVTTRFDLSDGRLTLITSRDVVEVVDTIAADSTGGPPRQWGFNARYLIEAVSAFGADTVNIAGDHALAPMRVCEDVNSPDFGIVMPARLQ